MIHHVKLDIVLHVEDGLVNVYSYSEARLLDPMDECHLVAAGDVELVVNELRKTLGVVLWRWQRDRRLPAL